MATFILSEASAGYSLYEVVQFEAIGGLIEQAQETVTEISRFEKSVKLKAFHPFKDAHEALDNVTAISEHEVHATLKEFLQRELPSTKKGKPTSFKLGVVESALATAINEALGTSDCTFVSETVREVLRGIRAHQTKMVPTLAEGSSTGKSILMQVR